MQRCEKKEVILKGNDLAEVLEALQEAKNEAYNLGLKLEVPQHEARAIHDNNAPKDCLSRIIERFLQVHPMPSWRVIVNALRSPLVNLQRLANEIESAKLLTTVEEIDEGHNGTTPVQSKPPMTDMKLATYTSHSGRAYKSRSSGCGTTNDFSALCILPESTQLKTMVVLNELQQLSVDETKRLMLYLNVPLKVLNEVESKLFGDDCRKMRFIDEWLRLDSSASWRKLSSGLRIMKKDSIAGRIDSMFVEVTDCTQQSIEATNLDKSVKEFLIKVAKAKSIINDLNYKFLNLTCNTLTSLNGNVKKKPQFLEDVRNYLIMLPMANQRHERFFSEQENDILEAKDMYKLFKILRDYCYYLNYDIVFDIIKRFCDHMKQEMLDYSASVEEFEKSTTADVFLRAISCDPENKKFEKFKRMALKINKPSSECTLYEIRQLEIALADAASVYKYSMYLGIDSEGSVGMSLYVHPACVDLVRAAMTPEFMESYHLTLEGIVGRELDANIDMDIEPFPVQSLQSLPLALLTTSLPLTALPPSLHITSPLQPTTPLQTITTSTTSPTTTSPVESSAQFVHPPTLPLVPVSQLSLPSPISDQPGTSRDKVSEVKATIQHFKDEFQNLFHCTQTYIENQDANFFSEFRSYLLSLPVSDWDRSVTLFNRDEITGAQKTSEIFTVFGNYCNYFHHDLLVAINMRFCEVPLKRRMLEYQKAFERFEEATDTKLFLQAVPVFPSLKFFDRCSVVLDNHLATSDCKLSKLKEMKYDLANVYAVRLYGLFIENIRGDPIVVTFRIHPNVEVPPKPIIITIKFGCGR